MNTTVNMATNQKVLSIILVLYNSDTSQKFMSHVVVGNVLCHIIASLKQNVLTEHEDYRKVRWH
jgi:hypothetical protein